MLAEFSSRAALEQQSHKQTAVLSGESAISRRRTASVLQQAINTESITAPGGAAGPGRPGAASSERSAPAEEAGGAEHGPGLGCGSGEDREEGASCLRPNGV